MALITLQLEQKGVVNAPAANAQATISTPAPNPTSRIIVKGLIVSLMAGATAPASSQQWVLRDGATGVGTIILTGKLMVPIGGGQIFGLSDLQLPCSPGNVATLEFIAAGGATVEQTVSLTYGSTDWLA